MRYLWSRAVLDCPALSREEWQQDWQQDGGIARPVTMPLRSPIGRPPQSGTFESVVYDTVLEETGNSDAFERTIGRVRLVESVGLVASALIGGAIAEIAPLRATYFLTVRSSLRGGRAVVR
jgi:hypothetical protein